MVLYFFLFIFYKKEKELSEQNARESASKKRRNLILYSHP